MGKRGTKVHSASLVALLGSALLVGCGPSGPEIAEVSGVVTLDSEPLIGATVTFSPDQGRESIGYTVEGGRYVLRYTRDTMGALVGSHKVRIITATEHAPRERLHPRYHRQTELREEVNRGSNEINFDLKSK